MHNCIRIHVYCPTYIMECEYIFSYSYHLGQLFSSKFIQLMKNILKYSNSGYEKLTYLLMLPLTHCPRGGGGSGEGRGRGGSVKGKGRDGRNSATAQGRSHRSRTVREVGWEGQEKRCAVVWGAPRQEGHSASGLRPTLSK